MCIMHYNNNKLILPQPQYSPDIFYLLSLVPAARCLDARDTCPADFHDVVAAHDVEESVYLLRRTRHADDHAVS